MRWTGKVCHVPGIKRGKGARSAVGMNALPNNVAVEIEAIFEID